MAGSRRAARKSCDPARTALIAAILQEHGGRTNRQCVLAGCGGAHQRCRPVPRAPRKQDRAGFTFRYPRPYAAPCRMLDSRPLRPGRFRVFWPASEDRPRTSPTPGNDACSKIAAGPRRPARRAPAAPPDGGRVIELFDVPAFGAAGLAGIGVAAGHGGVGGGAPLRARRAPATLAEPLPAVTVLKPLHGDEPLLEEALASFFGQDYPGFQIVFGAAGRGRPGARHRAAPLRALSGARRRARGGRDTARGEPQDRQSHQHDAGRAPRYAGDRRQRHACRARLPAPGRGRADGAGGRARHHALCRARRPRPACRASSGRARSPIPSCPGALLARALGRQDCLGATMALRRETLDAVGGFEALVAPSGGRRGARPAGQRAGAGHAARGNGAGDHGARAARHAACSRHELRWGRTIVALVPLGYRRLGDQYPLFWAALAVLGSGLDEWAWLLFALAWLCRGQRRARDRPRPGA